MDEQLEKADPRHRLLRGHYIARYIRLDVTDAEESRFLQLAEIGVYNTA